MNILDLSNYIPLRFGFTEQPETYDYEKPERLLALLKQVVVHHPLELLIDSYELVFYIFKPVDVIEFPDGTHLQIHKEPVLTTVSLHPHLFLLCLRCRVLSPNNQVPARELIRHLEAEIMRRKLQALIED